MSKLIKMYKNLKTQNSEKIYLFKSGIFYIFLDEDAREMSKALDFKLTSLNDEFVKCGFPSNSFDKYMNLIKKLNYDVEIVNPNNNMPYPVKSYSENLDVSNLLNEIVSIDVDNLSVREAYSFLDKIKYECKKIMQSQNNSDIRNSD